MKEILTSGDITKDFNRLGIKIRETYKGEEYSIHEITNEEFKIMCEEPDVDGTWNECLWRYCEGSNQDVPNKKIILNGKEIVAWYDDTYDFESEEEKVAYLKEYGEKSSLAEYNNLLEYLCYHMGCSQPRNVCALTKDLAKVNNMKLSELFKIYQN